MDQFLTLVATRGPLLLCVSAIILAVHISSKLSDWNLIQHIPALDEDLGSPDKRRKAFLANPTEAYKKGYKLFGEKAFRLMTENGTWRIM